MLRAAAAPEFPIHLGPMDKERPPLLPSLIPPLQHSGHMLPSPDPATQGRQGVDNSGNNDELLDLGTNSTLPTPLTRVECQGQAGESVTPPLFAAKGDRCYLIGANACSHALRGNEAVRTFAGGRKIRSLAFWVLNCLGRN